MTEERPRLSGVLISLLIAAGFPGCAAGETRARDDDGFVTVPRAPQAEMPAECRSPALRQRCDALDSRAHELLVELMVGAEIRERPRIDLFAGSRLRYSVGLRFTGVPRGAVASDYRFVFSRWHAVEVSGDLLVFRKTVGGQPYEATIRLHEVGRLDSVRHGYDVEGSMETTARDA